MNYTLYRWQLFIHLNILDLKHYLRLDLAPEGNILLQLVMVYNVLVWGIFYLQHRHKFRRYVTGSDQPNLSWPNELHAAFGNRFPRDPEYQNLKFLYRLYFCFLIFLIIMTIIFWLPQTWTIAAVSHFYRFLSLLITTRLLAQR
jgi:hypothetical protein